jgi:sugar lactone lactonase YvrE
VSIGAASLPGRGSRRDPVVTGAGARHRSSARRTALLGRACLAASPDAAAQGSYIITAVAGGGAPADANALAVGLPWPFSVAADAAGNVWIAEAGRHQVLRLDPAGVIRFVAGTGASGYGGDGGPAHRARLNAPSAAVVDGAGHLFIADTYNHRVRRVDAGTGVITTIAGTGVQGFAGDGGPAAAARLDEPLGIAVGPGGHLFISDTGNNRVRRVDAATGYISTVAGGGTDFDDGVPATSAGLARPRALAFDVSGNLLIADQYTRRVRRVEAATGLIGTVAGGGSNAVTDGAPATSVGLNPTGVAVDAAGNIFIADPDDDPVGGGHFRPIRKVDAATGTIWTYAGNGTWDYCGDGGPATSACLGLPESVAVDASGRLLVADEDNLRLRRVDPGTGTIATVAGTGTAGGTGDGGPATSALLNNPFGAALDPWGGILIADAGNHRVRRVDPATGLIETVAGNGAAAFSGDGGAATAVSLNSPRGVAVDGADNLWIADRSNHRVRRVDAATGLIETVAGTGTAGYSGDGRIATTARLNGPRAVVVDEDGNLYIADEVNHRVRMVESGSGVIRTLAGDGVAGSDGDGGPFSAARLASPAGLAVEASGGILIADRGNGLVRRLTPVAGVPAIAHRPDGFRIAGSPLVVQPAPGGTRLLYDAASCPAPEYNLYYGTAASLPGRAYTGAACDLGASGSAVVALPDPPPGDLLWMLVVGSDGAFEGGHGFDGAGVERPLAGTGLCGVQGRSASTACGP